MAKDPCGHFRTKNTTLSRCAYALLPYYLTLLTLLLKLYKLDSKQLEKPQVNYGGLAR